MAFLLDGKFASQVIKQRLKEHLEIEKKKGLGSPVLAILRSEDEAGSNSYFTSRQTWANYLGIEIRDYVYPKDASEKQLVDQIIQWNQDEFIDGIMIDHPLPKGFNEEKIVSYLNPLKDVDGMHTENAGQLFHYGKGFVPNTARGVMELLKFYKVDLSGKHVVVLGRSNTVGKPLAQLLLQQNATVTICHSKTTDLKKWTQQADAVIVAIGKKQMITKEYISPGTIVVDVGIHYDEKGHLCGDVHPNVMELASMVSPVPGGVGPMTTLSLMMNVIDAYDRRKK